MAGRLHGKVAVITGAARGQGAAAAERFVREGARVLLCDVDDDAGRYLAAQLGDGAWYRRLDVSDEAGWQAMVGEIDQAFGRLDVLVNNAGVISFSPLVDTTLAEYEHVIRVNQIGTFLGMRECVPIMKRAGRGSIINITSVEGLAGMPWLTAYAASKFAIRGMTKVAAAELGPHGVRVNSVNPGAIDPAMGATALGGMPIDLGLLGDRVPLGRAGQAEEVANLVLFLASDESSYCTGGEFVADGGATSAPPGPEQQPRPVPPAPAPQRPQVAMPQAPQWEQQRPAPRGGQWTQPRPTGGGYEQEYTPDRPWVAEGGRRGW
jgi:3alpha(or 20beta)-hydroxysteroid dehydrogenase